MALTDLQAPISSASSAQTLRQRNLTRITNHFLGALLLAELNGERGLQTSDAVRMLVEQQAPAASASASALASSASSAAARTPPPQAAGVRSLRDSAVDARAASGSGSGERSGGDDDGGPAAAAGAAAITARRIYDVANVCQALNIVSKTSRRFALT